MTRFDGKTALVTGGGTGIGKAIAASLAREGARVALAGRRREPLGDVALELGGVAIAGDIGLAADRRRIVGEAVRALGHLDILVNNAGAFLAKPLVETTDEEIETVFRTNLTGLIALTREALPHILAARGAIVSVSSVVSTGVMTGTSIYSSSKAALDHFTRLLAAEVGPAGVRVNAVAPGLTDTDMAASLLADAATVAATTAQTPLRRIGGVEDIARVVAFLASSDAAWVTGQVLQASGGLML
jgi:NAD(P)-dependent dehydrogenase (short-subunit alcohol dehydrogenase family)